MSRTREIARWMLTQDFVSSKDAQLALGYQIHTVHNAIANMHHSNFYDLEVDRSVKPIRYKLHSIGGKSERLATRQELWKLSIFGGVKRQSVNCECNV